MKVMTIRRTVKRNPAKVAPTARSFRELTRNYFARERHWEFLIEAALFAILVSISVWPVLVAASALSLFLRGAPG